MGSSEQKWLAEASFGVWQAQAPITLKIKAPWLLLASLEVPGCPHSRLGTSTPVPVFVLHY